MRRLATGCDGVSDEFAVLGDQGNYERLFRLPHSCGVSGENIIDVLVEGSPIERLAAVREQHDGEGAGEGSFIGDCGHWSGQAPFLMLEGLIAEKARGAIGRAGSI